MWWQKILGTELKQIHKKWRYWGVHKASQAPVAQETYRRFHYSLSARADVSPTKHVSNQWTLRKWCSPIDKSRGNTIPQRQEEISHPGLWARLACQCPFLNWVKFGVRVFGQAEEYKKTSLKGVWIRCYFFQHLVEFTHKKPSLHWGFFLWQVLNDSFCCI